MALKSAKGADRVLYGLSALLQNKMPSGITSYNAANKAEVLIVIPGDSCTFSTATSLSVTCGENEIIISFPAGTYEPRDIIETINTAETVLTAVPFGKGILLSAPASIKVKSAFLNLRAGQIINHQPLVMPNSFIISGTLPPEKDVKAYPSVVIELQNIQPEDDGVMVTYSVALTVGVTSPINSSQADYMSRQLLKYYDVIRDILMVDDDGSLGGIANGVNIISGGIDEATGVSYFLKFLTISLEVSVEED